MGYIELLRAHPHFRRLWLADVASLFGDWLNTLAIFALVRAITDSPAALGIVFIAKLLPSVFAAPFAGLLVDRLDRRRLMIVADLARAVVVCGFLFIDAESPLFWVYALAVLQVAIGTAFQPARTAATPNVVPIEALGTANALGAITWSTIRVAGAGVGGVLVDLLGVQAVFLIDAATYVLSAFFIARAVIPQHTDPAGEGRGAASVVAGIREGIGYMRRESGIGRVSLAKAVWSFGPGAIFFLLVFISPVLLPEAPSTSQGLLYMFGGIGTGLGPVLARRFVPEGRRAAALGWFIVAGALAYGVFAVLPWTLATLLLVILTSSGGGATWVTSTVLLQERSEDRFRGRVFANEIMAFTLCNALGIGVASLVLEFGAPEREVLFAAALLSALTGWAYAVWVKRGEAATLVPVVR